MSDMEATPASPEVAVIIVNFNGGDMLAHCLKNLSQQTWKSFRVIVVDNASSDNSLDLAESASPRFETIRLDQNVGFAAGNNIGAAHAPECRWIALLNPDAYAEPDWLENLMREAKTRPEYAFFGSKLILAETPDRLDGTGDVYHVSGAAWRRDHGRNTVFDQIHGSGEIFAPCAAAALYRRDVFDAIGGFDEDYFCYFEDVDLGFRMRLLGHRCYYVSDAVVHHMGSAITGYQSPFTVYHGHRNLVWTFVKDMPWPLFLFYLPFHLFLNFASIVLYTCKGQPLTILRAKRDALRGLAAAWRKRRKVQQGRTTSALSLWRLMARGFVSLHRRA